MFTKRSSGILMHPTSLPSRGGIGDLGPAAYEFVNWLAAAKQTLWQILPFGPVGYGNSPYSCTSAFAGNVLMISLERLAERGYLDPARLSDLPDGEAAVDFEDVRALKLPLLREAARNFLQSAGAVSRQRFDAFCSENQWWLEDYALFSVLREHFGDHPWNSWPEEIARRKPEALAAIARGLEGPAGARALPAVRLLRAMESAASLFRRARYPHHRRRRDLRQLRQRRRLDPSRHLSLAGRPLAGMSWPACRPMHSARPASAGAIRFMTGRP